MSRTSIALCSLLVPLALFAQPAPDTLWTRIIWDAPGAAAQAVVQVDGGFVVASNRGQEVHLCMVDDSGNVIWSRWYGTELRGAINNHRLLQGTDGKVNLALLGDSAVTACIDTQGSIGWSRACLARYERWESDAHHSVDFWILTVAPLQPGGFRVVVYEAWNSYGIIHHSIEIILWDSLCVRNSDYWERTADSWADRDLWTSADRWAWAATIPDSVCLASLGIRRCYSGGGTQALHATGAFPSGFFLLVTDGSNEHLVHRLDSTGQMLWSQSLPFSGGSANDIESVLDCGCVVAGTTPASSQGTQAFLARLDASGEPKWTGYYGGAGDVLSNDVVFSTRSGGFVLAGQVAQSGTAYPYILCTRPDTAYWYSEITDFVAAACDSGVEITFSAPVELNVDRYELLRYVGGSYRAVGTIPAGGVPIGHRRYLWVDHLAGGHLQYSLADIGGNGQRREHPNLIALVDRVPTRILDFTAWEDSGRVLMMMRTAFEYGVDHYVLQRHRGPETISVAVVPSHGASYGGSPYKAEDHDYQAGYEFVYYPVAVDSSGMVWSFVESADTVLTENPPSPPPGPDVVLDYTLSAFPNPFNANTTLYFATSRTENVRIDVYDLVGRFVKTAVNQEYAPGGWRVPFDAAGLPSGIYFARINIAAGFTATQKLLLLR